MEVSPTLIKTAPVGYPVAPNAEETMKITKVEAFHVDWGGGRSRSAWVRIGTDAGVTGLGEASPMVHGNASLWLKLGPVQVKIRFDADKTARDVDLAGDIAKARAVRKLVGDDFPLAFDSNNGYSVQGAIRVGRALEELGSVWFEEPVQHYHVESVAKVAATLDIAVSAGEQEYTLQGIKRLIEAGVDIVQPDIVKTGGFTGLGDMAALARAYGVDLVPHQTQPSIGHTANLHFVASPTHSHHPAEYNGPRDVQDVVFKTPVRPVNGKFVLSDAPGLGLEVDESQLDKRMIRWTSSAAGG